MAKGNLRLMFLSSRIATISVRRLAPLAMVFMALASPRLQAQDSRNLKEPQFPPSCIVLTANQAAGNLNESLFDTERIQAAINNCPPGQAVELQASGSNDAFLIQPIKLAPEVTLLVDAGATVLASLNPNDYACNVYTGGCLPLIQAYDAPGAGIMGYGIIDGRGGQPLLGENGIYWWTNGDPRPHLIDVDGSDNFTLYKITLQNSPMFHFYGGGNDLTIWGIKITAPGCDSSTGTPFNGIPVPEPCVASPNTDGVDPSVEYPGTVMSNVTITNSYISDGDDHIAIKAGNGPVSNVTISNDHLYTGHGVSIGSETAAGANYVLVTNIAMDGAWGESQNGLRIKSYAGAGGEVYDIDYENICLENAGHPFVFDPYYDPPSGPPYPNFHDITMHNVHLLNRQSYSTFRGYDTDGVSNPLTMTLNNVQMDGYQPSDFEQTDSYGPKVGNAVFTAGPDPVNFLATLQSLSGNGVTVYDYISDNNAAYDCTNQFVYLAGELIGPAATVPAGQALNLTAIVQPIVYASPAPTGTITVYDGGAPVASSPVSAPADLYGGSLPRSITSIQVPSVSAGTHNYTAQYSGDSNYAALSFGALTVTAAQGAAAPTLTTLTSSAVELAAGNSVSLTANVSSGAGVPAGAVTFYENSNAMGAPVALNSSGTASLASGPLAVGVYNFTASYGGSAGYNSSSSAAVTVYVVSAVSGASIPTTTTLAVSAAQVVAGAPVTLTASVGAAAGLPTGGVSFVDGGNTLGTAALNSAGMAVFPATLAGYGAHSITAVYGGDAFFMGSTSNAQTITVVGTCEPPVVTPPALVMVQANGVATITLLANPGAYCSSSDTLVYSLVTGPANGQVTLAGAVATYTPNFAYTGSDSFTFQVSDANATPTAAAPVTVLLMVMNIGPQLLPDPFSQTVVAGINGKSGYAGDGGPALSATMSNPRKIAVDSFGNVYIADFNNSVIRKVNAATGVITTVAGYTKGGSLGPSCPSPPFDRFGDGCPATQAYLVSPRGVAVDAQGDIFISDENKSMIRMVEAATGQIWTLAGNGSSGYSGDGGPSYDAKVKNPEGISLDRAGNLYIADSKNYVIREINTAGIISTVAGSDVEGYSGDGGPATEAQLGVVLDVSTDAAGNIYIADSTYSVIREVDVATGYISTIAGNGSNSFSGPYDYYGWATETPIIRPAGVTADPYGNLYIADSGSGIVYYYDAETGWMQPINMTSEGPYGVALDSQGNLYFADYGNFAIDEIPTGAQIGSLAAESSIPSNTYGVDLWLLFAPNDAPAAGYPLVLGNPDFAISSAGTGQEGDQTTNDYLQYQCNASLAGLETATLDARGTSGTESRYALSCEGFKPWVVADPGTAAVINDSPGGAPQGLAMDGAGNLYLADAGTNVVWKFDTSGNGTVVAGTAGSPGYGGDGGLATAATLNAPQGVAVDAAGNIYIADTGNNLVRRVDAISGVIGTASSGCIESEAVYPMPMSQPTGLAVDLHENVYIADTGNNRVCRIDPLSGQTETAVGTGTVCSHAQDSEGDDCPPLQSTLNAPTGLAVDVTGDLFIADTGNKLLREVNLGTGLITSVTGKYEIFTNPTGVAVDAAGDVYFADSANHTVGVIGAASVMPITLAGQAGISGPAGANGGPASSFELDSPFDIAVNGLGNVYVSDTGNDRLLSINRSQLSMQFGTVSGGSTSSPQTATIWNTGNYALKLSWPPPAPGGGFTVSGGTCKSGVLAPGYYCTLEVTFSPVTAGLSTEALTINSNAPNSPQIQLSGTGTNIVVAITPTVTITCGAEGYFVFDGMPQGCTVTVTGPNGNVVNGTTTITYDGSPTVPSNAGTYAVSAAFTSGDPNYTNASATGSLVITPAAATVTANNEVAIYGQPLPALTYTVAPAGISWTQVPACTATATSTSPAGQYPITCSGGEAANYAVTYLPGTLTMSALEIRPPALVFGTQTTGTSSVAQYVTLTNIGVTPLSVTGASLTGNNPGDYKVTDQAGTCSTGMALAAGRTCVLRITFSPGGAGASSATLLAGSAAAGSPYSVALSGTGVAPVPQMTLSTTAVSFANPVAVGASTTAQYVTIGSTGTAPLQVSGVTLGGADPQDFRITDQAGTCTTGMTLAYNVKCNLRVVFTPTAAGARGAILYVADNAAGSPQAVALSGTGEAPPGQLTVSPTALTFGTSWIGQSTLVAQYVQITSSGPGPVTVSGVTATGADPGDFSFSDYNGSCVKGTILAPGAKCTVRVVFTPGAACARTATLVIESNAAGVPNVALSGTGGTPQITLSTSALDFGTAKAGSKTVAQYVAIASTGTTPVTVSGVSLGGPDPGDFLVTNQAGTCTTGMTLNPGAKCNLRVQFAPQAVNARSASLTINSSAEGPAQSVALSGTGD
jgi:polygalacturonase/sugar lactone lactonase YvrE